MKRKMILVSEESFASEYLAMIHAEEERGCVPGERVVRKGRIVRCYRYPEREGSKE